MYCNFVPINLHGQAKKLITELQLLSNQPAECPYCQHNEWYAVNTSSGYFRCKRCKRGFNRSLNTPFYRLAPLELLPIIAEGRLSGKGYTAIRHELKTCSSWIIKRRIKVIEEYMQTRYPQLHQWYMTFINGAQQSIPDMVEVQLHQLKTWLNELLLANTAQCPYCDSTLCQKVGETRRAQFRCKSCWRYFSNLKGTGLEHLGRSESWIAMIDLLVTGKSNREIEQILNISAGTVVKARKSWLDIMQRQNVLILQQWVANQQN